MTKPRLITFIILIIAAPLARSQSIAVPLKHDVYEFLKKMEALQLVTGYRDIIKPISRLHAARLLLVVDTAAARLSPVDLRRLSFLKTEFGFELGLMDESWAEAPRRWHPITMYLPDNGILNLDLQLGYSVFRSQGRKLDHLTNGFKTYGYAFQDFGFAFSFADNRESGNAIDPTRTLTPREGVVTAMTRPNSFEYDFTDVQFSYEHNGLTLSLEKIPMWWSTGRHGSLMLSTKAPPPAQFRFRAEIADWIDFTYIHAELNSNVIDSARSYYANSSSIRPFYRTVFRQKYLAAHTLEMSLFSWLDVSLGESIVYSDKNPQLLYLIPVMFFKSGEHYNKDTDNSQFFLSADAVPYRGINLFGSMFIDELATYEINNADRSRYQLGYTLGFQIFDLPVSDIELLAEYSRLNPWVYSHKFTAANFTNSGYDMGHWIGQNADDLFLELVYRPERSMRASISYEELRKGGSADVVYQYSTPSLPFLYGRVHKEYAIGARVVFQPVRDVFVEGIARTVRVTDDGSPWLSHGQKPEFTLAFRYGIW